MVELFPLSEVRELGRKYCLNMLRVPREYVSLSRQESDLHAIRAFGRCRVEKAIEMLQELVIPLRFGRSIEPRHRFVYESGKLLSNLNGRRLPRAALRSWAYP